ncbi:hypothetical protein [Streptomyces sp. NPDC058371]|jgi:hypothetical protein|uniref:hypothetical protein n=1 Tax=Streptomyces sp. NPDC058371 TaxID=3346463 RepID=UPI003667CFF3
MRRLIVGMISATLLILSIGVVPAGADSSSQATESARHGQTAQDDSACRTEYTAGGWDAMPCVSLTSSTFDGWGYLWAHPSSCANYRIYLVDAATGKLVQSTSARACSETISPDVFADASRFTQLRAFTRFRAFNSSGGTILTLDSPAVQY